MAQFGKTMVLVGLLVLVAAVAWWYAFFEQILGGEVKQASDCFYYTTELCGFGGLVGTVGSIPAYSPVAFWFAVALMVLGLIALAFAPRKS